MRTVNTTELRKNISFLFSIVEEGETIVIERHGKSIAKISPTNIEGSKDIPNWKKPGLKLHAKGKALSSIILNERKEK